MPPAQRNAPMEPTKLQRWIDLVAFLASRRFPVAKEALWRQLPAYSRGLDGTPQEQASVGRMFERDKDELREMGIAIETAPVSACADPGDGTGYRLSRRLHLPRLRVAEPGPPAAERGRHPLPGAAVVSPPEAVRALGGLRELATVPGFPLASDAQSAFRKLSFDLMPRGLPGSPVRYAASAEADRAAKTLARLFDAVSRRKKLTFSYQSMTRSGALERRVRPYGLLFELGRWYVVGHDERREDARVFRVGRMSTVRVERRSPGAPDFELPDDFDLTDFANRMTWELGPESEEEEVVVHFDFPCSEWAGRNDHGELVTARDDGSELRRFRVRDLDRFVRWALGLAGRARIVEPERARDRFREIAAAVAGAHASPVATPLDRRKLPDPDAAPPPAPVAQDA